MADAAVDMVVTRSRRLCLPSSTWVGAVVDLRGRCWTSSALCLRVCVCVKRHVCAHVLSFITLALTSEMVFRAQRVQKVVRAGKSFWECDHLRFWMILDLTCKSLIIH